MTSQISLFDMIDEHGGSINFDQLATIILQLKRKPLSEAQRLGEILHVQGSQFESNEHLIYVLGADSGRIYGEIRIQADELRPLALYEYILSAALNHFTDHEKLTAAYNCLCIAKEKPDDPALLDKWQEDEKQREKLRQKLANNLAHYQEKQALWSQLAKEIPLEGADFLDHFDRLLRKIWLSEKSDFDQVGPLSATGKALILDPKNSEGKRIPGCLITVNASYADNWKHGQIEYRYYSSVFEEQENIHMVQQLAQMMGQRLQAVLNKEDLIEIEDPWDCSDKDCTFESQSFLQCLDHECKQHPELT